MYNNKVNLIRLADFLSIYVALPLFIWLLFGLWRSKISKINKLLLLGLYMFIAWFFWKGVLGVFYNTILPGIITK